MKPFSSSVLSIKESITYSPQLLDKVTVKKSPLVRLLEFDESIAQNDIDSTRAYYMSLLKYSNNPTPRNEDSVYSTIFNQYESVKTICCGLICTDNYNDLIGDYYTKLNKLEENILKNPEFNDNIKIYTTVKIPNKCHNDIVAYPIIEYSKRVLKAIESRNFDEIKDYHTLGSDVCNHIASAICDDDTVDDIDSFIDSYKNAFFFNESGVPASVAISMTKQGLTTMSESIIYTYIDGHSFNYTDSLIRTLRTNADMIEDPNIIRTIIQNVCDAMTAITIINIKCSDINYNMKKAYIEHNISAVMNYIESKVDNFSESMSMFGDAEIDASNVFDLLDDDEFNHSYYMDLALVAQHEMAMTRIRAHKEALIQEAVMVTEGTADISIIEAGIGAKIKEGFKKIIEFIRSIGARFKESILFNFASEKTWLQKYKMTILNNGYDPETDISFHCNIDFIKLITNVVPPSISYQQLRQNPDAFTDEDSFFKKYFKNHMPGFDSFITERKIDNDESLANKCKWYLGAELPGGDTITKKFKNIDMAKMYTWLIETDKLAKETDDQLKIIERTVENYTKQAELLSRKNDQKTQQGSAEPAKEQPTEQPATKKEESTSFIFGYRHGELIAEASIMENVDVKTPDNDSGSPPPANKPVQGSNKNNNNSDANYKQSGSEAKKEIQDSGDEAELVAGRMQIYLNICQAVMSAKYTAILFAHKECLSLMRSIVKAKLGNSADIKLRSQNPKNNTNTTPKSQEEPKK